MLWYGLVFGMHFVFFLLCYGLYRAKLKILEKLNVKYNERETVDYQQWIDEEEFDDTHVN